MTHNEWKQFSALCGLIDEAIRLNMSNDEEVSPAERRAMELRWVKGRFMDALLTCITSDPHYLTEKGAPHAP